MALKLVLNRILMKHLFSYFDNKMPSIEDMNNKKGTVKVSPSDEMAVEILQSNMPVKG